MTLNKNSKSMGRYHGKRCIIFARCSNKHQADTSPKDQVALLKVFAGELGLIVVGEIIREGTGSIPGGRDDLEKLLERKLSINDYEVLLVQDASRLTRGGALHGSKIEYDFNAAGVEIVYAKETIPDGPAGGMVKSLSFYAAQDAAMKTSLASARGCQSALEERRKAYCGTPPYAVDRLYSSPDGVPKYIIRNETDGSQKKLHHDSGAVMEVYPPKAKNHHIKQKDEIIHLIPGDPKKVQIVRDIYRRKFADGWGWWRIACELNDKGIPAPRGGLWFAGSVRCILQNTIYTGRAIANRKTRAIYNMRAPGSPKASKVTQSELANRKHLPIKIRPRDEWFEYEESALVNFLEPEIRKLAMEYHETLLQRHASGHAPKPNRDRHHDSPYILKGILTTKQGGYPLTGNCRQGIKRKKYRYYNISKATKAPLSKDTLYRKVIPAPAIESVVLHALQSVLNSAPQLRTMLIGQIKAEQARQANSGVKLDELRKQHASIKRKITFIIDNHETIGVEPASEQFVDYYQQLSEIERQIRIAESGSPVLTESAESLADDIISGMNRIAEDLKCFNIFAIRKLLEVLVSKAVVDLETRHLELEFRVPSWAIGKTENWWLVDSPPRKTANEPNTDFSILMRFKLWWIGRRYIGFGIAAA